MTECRARYVWTAVSLSPSATVDAGKVEGLNITDRTTQAPHGIDARRCCEGFRLGGKRDGIAFARWTMRMSDEHNGIDVRR